MNYGLSRKFEIYDFDENKESKVISRPSAWHAAMLFQESNADAIPENMSSPYSVYIWGYYAIKHAGLGKKYGMPDKLTLEYIPKMMERYSFASADVDDADMGGKESPLA